MHLDECLRPDAVLERRIWPLRDAGNTVTLAHYLELLRGAGLLAGRSKFSQKFRQRGFSPKLQVLNTALMTALAHTTFAGILADRDHWGRRVESAIGARLLNGKTSTGIVVQHWLDRNREVDFHLVAGDVVTAIEVKSGTRKTSLPGMEAFAKDHRPKRQLLVGAQGITLEKFLMKPDAHWVA